ncbi:putative Chemotaxis protein [Hyella patelloides LEGE 07179]|uniref:Putative Chemotaxis protein n=1 Tax=Hyella patelloides LEGE 07179 TaxID=945734 RepID=A0A563VXY8_9CYAN|nr:chemotaxis protein CheW [Hyella patelloides]VEP16143.1 putative Chemotaxis protein [Hyella patelloides LEGE 07179]
MNQITTTSSVTPTANTETCKAIVVSIAEHLLALPVTAVFKVIRSSFVYSSNLGENRLIHIEEQTLPLIDLYHLLVGVKPNNEPDKSLSLTPEEEKFLVLAKSDTGKLVAIIVDEPPTLMDLPLSHIYALPHSQQQNLGNIASHIAIVPHQTSHLTVMLLDVQQALMATGFSQGLAPYASTPFQFPAS